MNTKIIYSCIILAIAALAAWNIYFNSSKSELSDLSLANVEAMAGESTGTFPACQKKEGTKDPGYIPYCVNGVCKKNTWEKKGILDVNYCD
jgi:hypothetical protein